jgi:hypothetical protein
VKGATKAAIPADVRRVIAAQLGAALAEAWRRGHRDRDGDGDPDRDHRGAQVQQPALMTPTAAV